MPGLIQRSDLTPIDLRICPEDRELRPFLEMSGAFLDGISRCWPEWTVAVTFNVIAEFSPWEKDYSCNIGQDKIVRGSKYRRFLTHKGLHFSFVWVPCTQDMGFWYPAASIEPRVPMFFALSVVDNGSSSNRFQSSYLPTTGSARWFILLKHDICGLCLVG